MTVPSLVTLSISQKRTVSTTKRKVSLHAIPQNLMPLPATISSKWNCRHIDVDGEKTLKHDNINKVGKIMICDVASTCYQLCPRYFRRTQSHLCCLNMRWTWEITSRFNNLVKLMLQVGITPLSVTGAFGCGKFFLWKLQILWHSGVIFLHQFLFVCVCV